MGHEFEQTLRESEGQGSLACCRPWSRKESGLTEQMNDIKGHKEGEGFHRWVGAMLRKQIALLGRCFSSNNASVVTALFLL